MGKTNKLKKHSKTVIASTVGVGILLATPTYMSAETLKTNNVGIQEVKPNTELKEGINNNQETPKVETPTEGTEVESNEGKTEVTANEDKTEVKSNDGKTEVKPNTDKAEVKEEVKVQEDSLKEAEEPKPNAELTRSNPVMQQQASITPIQETQIIMYSNGNSIWSQPYGVEGANYIDSTNTYAGKEVKLINKMTVNNTVWYQFSSNGRTIGWIDGKVLSKLTNIQEINQDAIMGETYNNGIWSLPYGTSGANYLGGSNRYAYDSIKLVTKANSGAATWYKFSVNGKVIGWVDSKALDNGNIKPANFTTTVGSSSGHGIWSKPYGVEGSNYVASASQYAYQKVQVIKTVIIDKTTWYQIKNDKGIIGWIDGGKATTDVENLPIDSETALVKSNVESGHGVWSLPYGENGANWITSARDYSSKPVKIIQKVRKGDTIWSKIQMGDRVLGWVDSQILINQSINEENKTVMVGDVNGHSIWSVPFGLDGAKYVGSVGDYVNKIVKIDKSMQTGSTLWYHINVDGRDIGWLDSKSISSATDVRSRSGVYHVSTSEGRHGLWSRPFGMQNASWVGSAVDNKYKNLNLKMSINYNGVTWFAFDNGQGGVFWVDSQAVSEGTTFPRMNVPAIMQRDYSNPSRDLETGCEITAVTMMLQYAGANVDKVQMAREMPYHPYDPNQGYVGDPWSDGPINTVYPSALTGLVSKYTGSSMNLTGKSTWDIKDRLNNNHPVVAWVTMHGFGIHAITLTGYDNDRVYYNDPWTGEKDASISWWEFENNWSSKGKKALSY